MFGILVGVFSGIMGLGGGAIMIPIMVLALSMNQQTAHGTSLAVMIPPVTIGAVIGYWQKGQVDFRVALFMAIGVAMGTYFGARIATSVPQQTLKLIFGFTLIYIAAYTVFGKEHLLRTLLISGGLVGAAVGVYLLVQRIDRSIVSTQG